MLTVKSKYHFIKEAQQEVGKQLRRYVAYRYAVPSVTMEQRLLLRKSVPHPYRGASYTVFLRLVHDNHL